MAYQRVFPKFQYTGELAKPVVISDAGQSASQEYRDAMDVLWKRMNLVAAEYGWTFGNRRFLDLDLDELRQFAFELCLYGDNIPGMVLRQKQNKKRGRKRSEAYADWTLLVEIEKILRAASRKMTFLAACKRLVSTNPRWLKHDPKSLVVRHREMRRDFETQHGREFDTFDMLAADKLGPRASGTKSKATKKKK